MSAGMRAVDEDISDVIDHVEVEDRSATGRRLPVESPTEPDGSLPIQSGFRINRPQVTGVARVALSLVGVGGIRMGALQKPVRWKPHHRPSGIIDRRVGEGQLAIVWKESPLPSEVESAASRGRSEFVFRGSLRHCRARSNRAQ